MQVIPRQVAVHICGAGPTDTDLGMLSAAIGGGVGASVAIQNAGSLRALGSAAPAVGAAGGLGLAAAGKAGYGIGTFLYENSPMVQGVSQEMVGRVQDIGSAISKLLGLGGGTSPRGSDFEYACKL